MGAVNTELAGLGRYGSDHAGAQNAFLDCPHTRAVTALPQEARLEQEGWLAPCGATRERHPVHRLGPP